MSIIHSSTQRQFNVNNKCPLAVVKCSTTLSMFGVVLNKIPRYLKVYAHSITSPLNTNFWHGSIKLNTMTFVFVTFMVSPRSMQNCWNTSNYCWNPTSAFDVRTRSSAKHNSHTCTSAKANALHFVPSKRLSRASKYSPNSWGLREQPYFTPCWHLKLEVIPSLGWLMRLVALAYIACRHCKKCPLPQGQPTLAITLHAT
jgi:hypothetical protein